MKRLLAAALLALGLAAQAHAQAAPQSKLTRKTCVPFGNNQVAGQSGVFGSKQQTGTAIYSWDPSAIQSLLAWNDGWQDALALNSRVPYMQDMNGAFAAFSWEICYTLQVGIPEVDTGTFYSTGSIVASSPATYPPQLYAAKVSTSGATALPAWPASNATWGALGIGQVNQTLQVFTASGPGTYSTPSGVTKILVEIVGGGGGGTGGGSTCYFTACNGGTGGATIFGTVASSGGVGGFSIVPGFGGTGGTGAANFSADGNVGGYAVPSTQYAGIGAASYFGGSGLGGIVASLSGTNGTSGGGGGGGAETGTNEAGPGGGSGQYRRFVIVNPASSYSYTVGAGGAAGAAGTSGNAGGAGGNGVIIVTEYYN